MYEHKFLWCLRKIVLTAQVVIILRKPPVIRLFPSQVWRFSLLEVLLVILPPTISLALWFWWGLGCSYSEESDHHHSYPVPDEPFFVHHLNFLIFCFKGWGKAVYARYEVQWFSHLTLADTNFFQLWMEACDLKLCKVR